MNILTIRRLPAIHSFAHGTLKSVKKSYKYKKNTIYQITPSLVQVNVYICTTESLYDGVKIHIYIVQSFKIIYNTYIFFPHSELKKKLNNGICALNSPSSYCFEIRENRTIQIRRVIYIDCKSS